jgi:hypothetical protein
MRDGIGPEIGVGHGLLHRQEGIAGRIAHETARAAVDGGFEIDVGSAADLAAQSHLRVQRIAADTGAAGAQAVHHLVLVLAQARDDAHAGDDHAPHQKPSVEVNRPTLRSAAL